MTGDQNDIVSRLRSVLPSQWFDQNSNPIRDAILTGLANGHALIYSAIQYVKGQTRIKTASEGFLDLIANDYGTPARTSGQSDASFLQTILINLFRERATREGLIRLCTDLTGRPPTIIEPWNPGDCGAYDAPHWGYDVAGTWGSLLLPCQAFITVYRPLGQGIPNVAGYDAPITGYDDPSQGEWSNLGMVMGQLTDAMIYAALESVKPVGTVFWVNLTNYVET